MNSCHWHRIIYRNVRRWTEPTMINRCSLKIPKATVHNNIKWPEKQLFINQATTWHRHRRTRRINGNHRRPVRTLLKVRGRMRNQDPVSSKRTPKRTIARQIRSHLAHRLKSQMGTMLRMTPPHNLTINSHNKHCWLFQIMPIWITKLFNKSLNWLPISKSYLYKWTNKYNKCSSSISLSIISRNSKL